MNVLSSIYHAARDYTSERDRNIGHVPSPMERLPQDMLVLILQSIDSLRSLRAAVLASSAMYDAFQAAKMETLACVVSHSRPKEVEADAVTLSVFMHMHHQSSTEVAKALLIHNLWHPKKEWLFLPKSLSSPELLHFHWYVEYFTEKLFKCSMRRVHEKGWLGSGSDKLRFRRLSPNETIRIQRALYRIEFFSLYSRLDSEDPRELIRTPYWRKRVPVWEMEETACIQNLIYHRLAVVDSVIQSLIHDLDLPGDPRAPRAPKSKAWVRLLTRNIKCLIVAQDLGTLFRILSGPEKQTTRRLIRDILRESLRPTEKSRRNLLLTLVSEEGCPIPHLMLEGRNTEESCTLYLEKLRAPQEDSEYPSFGYVRAYRTKTLELVKMGHMNRKRSSLYNEKRYHEDRKWGYCLWDKDRMEYWGDDFHARSLRRRSQLRVTSQGSPGWTTIRLN